MRHLYSFLLLLVVITNVFLKDNGELYDAGRSTLINLNPMNFDTQITNNRNKERIRQRIQWDVQISRIKLQKI